MSHEIKKIMDIRRDDASFSPIIDAGYLFFADPPQLFIGGYPGETHREILAVSGKAKEEIAKAGRITLIHPLRLLVDESGSGTLGIKGENDPQPVVEFLRQLPHEDIEIINAHEIEKKVLCGSKG